MDYFQYRAPDGDILDANVKVYREYLASILEIIPADLKTISENCKSVYLYDAEVLKIDHDAIERRLEMELSGDYIFPNGFQTWCKYFLEYREVTRFICLAHSTDIGYQPGGFGDLLFQEIRILDDGQYRHCILFASGTELQIQFHDFHFRCEIM
ncbi:MAG: hypothetical protein JWQ02_934 [Capsulimonas sp.]|nr:hypothetical protein [Capsulimonas sp.]